MKSFTHKLLAFTLVIAFATGCASSVTDAGLEKPQQPETEQLKPADQPDDVTFGTDSEMSTVREKPE